MSGVRYLHGDDFTRADYEEVGRRRQHPDGQTFSQAVEALLPGQVCCVPSYHLSTRTPTTIGLGDAFVGGFISALVEAPTGRRGSTA
jgi:ADP-dependent phosphofructokinase/glucokinase